MLLRATLRDHITLHTCGLALTTLSDSCHKMDPREPHTTTTVWSSSVERVHLVKDLGEGADGLILLPDLAVGSVREHGLEFHHHLLLTKLRSIGGVQMLYADIFCTRIHLVC